MPESPPGEPAETRAKARSSTPTDARNPLLRRGFAPHPDRRPAAKIRIRNDPPQPPGKRSAQSGSGGEPNAAANLFRKSGVSGMTGASKGVESAERTGLPNIRRQPLPKTASAEQTAPSEILCHPGENTACGTSPPSEHPPPRGRAAQRTVGRPPQLRLHTPGNDEDSTRA